MINILIGALVWIVLVFTIPSTLTLGRPLSSKELEKFISNHKDDYELNDTSYINGDKVFYAPKGLPFIAEVPFIKFPFKWYINDYGVIWRWSKSSRQIDEMWEKLPKPKVKSLSEI